MVFNFLFFIVIISIFTHMLTENVHYPVVLWHGIGQSCCEKVGTKFVNEIFSTVPEVKYIRSIEIGCNPIMEIINSFTMNAFTQVEKACAIIKNDINLKDGYNAIGISQGGLLIRAVAQMCPEPPMKKLISLGAPQMGTFGIPDCDNEDVIKVAFLRKWCNRLFRWTPNDKYKSLLTPMQYWNSPYPHHMSARRNNSFLMKINNSYRKKQEKYKENLAKLELLVLVCYEKEQIVRPKESSLFGTYAPGTTGKILKMEETNLYKEDRIGLKTLHKENKIRFLEVKGRKHTSHPPGWLAENIYIPYL